MSRYRLRRMTFRGGEMRDGRVLASVVAPSAAKARRAVAEAHCAAGAPDASLWVWSTEQSRWCFVDWYARGGWRR